MTITSHPQDVLTAVLSPRHTCAVRRSWQGRTKRWRGPCGDQWLRCRRPCALVPESEEAGDILPSNHNAVAGLLAAAAADCSDRSLGTVSALRPRGSFARVSLTGADRRNLHQTDTGQLLTCHLQGIQGGEVEQTVPIWHANIAPMRRGGLVDALGERSGYHHSRRRHGRLAIVASRKTRERKHVTDEGDIHLLP